MDAVDRTVVVGGIRGLRGQPGVGSDGIGEEAIAEFFAFDCGQVLSVRIAGALVYVEFADPSGVHRALQKDGTESGGHLLHITPARPVGVAKQNNGVQLPPAGQLGPRGDWFQADKVADEGAVAGVGAFAGMPAVDKSRGALGHVPGAGMIAQGQAFAPQFVGQQLPFGAGYQQYQGAFTPGFGNSGFPPADGAGFGNVPFQGSLAPAAAQPRDTFSAPYGAGVYTPAPQQQYAAPFTAPAPAAQKGPISYAAVAAAGVPSAGVSSPPVRPAAPVQHHQPAPAARAVQPRAFGGHANDRVAAVAASVAASKLPLAAAISSVNQQVGGMSKRDSSYTPVLKMRGLPFSADKGDIIRFFEAGGLRLSKPLSEDSIHIVTEPSGRPAGIAFVEFSTPDEARNVVNLRNRKMMGSRYVELFPSSRDEATRVATGASKW